MSPQEELLGVGEPFLRLSLYHHQRGRILPPATLGGGCCSPAQPALMHPPTCCLGDVPVYGIVKGGQWKQGCQPPRARHSHGWGSGSSITISQAPCGCYSCFRPLGRGQPKVRAAGPGLCFPYSPPLPAYCAASFLLQHSCSPRAGGSA